MYMDMVCMSVWTLGRIANAYASGVTCEVKGFICIHSLSMGLFMI